MLLDDYEQQLSSHSFRSKSVDLSRELLRRDELSDIIANMTKTLHVNTPELKMQGTDSDLLSETYNNDSQQQLIDQLQNQLVQNQIQRTQPRNYSRILNQSNTPAYWYKAPPISRSIYFYDPSYQKSIRKQTKSPAKIKANIRTSSSQPRRNDENSINHSKISIPNNSSTLTPRTKYMIDLYHTAFSYNQHHQQQQYANSNPCITSPNTSRQNGFSSFRLQTIPTLPSIHSPKQQKENLLQSTQTNRLPLTDNSKKKLDPTTMPPIS